MDYFLCVLLEFFPSAVLKREIFAEIFARKREILGIKLTACFSIMLI